MEMNKFELKKDLIRLLDNLSNHTAVMMTRPTDEEAGEIKSKVYCVLEKTYQDIMNIVQSIY